MNNLTRFLAIKHVSSLLPMLATVVFSINVKAQTEPNPDLNVSVSQEQDTAGQDDTVVEVGNLTIKDDPVAGNTSVEEENTAEKCRDKIDNDGDKKLDCDDEDCSYIVFCTLTQPSQSPPLKHALTLDEMPHLRRTLLAAEILNLTSYLTPASAIAVLGLSAAAAGVDNETIGTVIVSLGPSSALLGSILASSAMTVWHSRVASAGYQVRSGPKAAAWLMSSLVIAANAAWWVMFGLQMNGNDSKGLTMGMIGIVIATPIINTIQLKGVDSRWEKIIQNSMMSYPK